MQESAFKDPGDWVTPPPVADLSKVNDWIAPPEPVKAESTPAVSSSPAAPKEANDWVAPAPSKVIGQIGDRSVTAADLPTPRQDELLPDTGSAFHAMTSSAKAGAEQSLSVAEEGLARTANVIGTRITGRRDNSLQQSGIYKSSQALKQAADETAPGAEEQQAHPYASAFGNAAGSGATMLPAAIVGGPRAMAAVFAMQQAGESGRAAQEAGKTPDQVGLATIKGAVFGATAGELMNAIPGASAIEQQSPGFASWAAAKLQQSLAEGAKFTGISQLSNWLSTEIERDYNPQAQFKVMNPAEAAGTFVNGMAMGLPAPARMAERGVAPSEQQGAGDAGASSPPAAPADASIPPFGAPPRTAAPESAAATPAPKGSYAMRFDTGTQTYYVADDQGNSVKGGFKTANQADNEADRLTALNAKKQEAAPPPTTGPESLGPTTGYKADGDQWSERFQKEFGTPGEDQVAQIDRAAQAADTNPSESQKAAGNYRKGHIDVQGIPVTIETARGTPRTGVDSETGEPWSVEAPDHYGYIKGTNGADGEHIDTYVGPKPDSPRAFIVDQVDPKTGQFDEHKVMLGYDNETQALDAYRRAFSDGTGDERIGGVTQMPIDQFKEWAKTADTSKPALDTIPSKADMAASAQDVMTPEDAARTLSPPAPEGMYSDIDAKVGRMADDMKARRLDSLNKKMTAGIITPREMYEREALSDTAPQRAAPPMIDDKARLMDKGQAVTASGRTLPVQYAMVEASDLVTSHDNDLRENTQYPQELQPRDRTRGMSEMQITDLLNPRKFQPALLDKSADAASGAPIVGHDSAVESGNGRIIALRRAYDEDLPTAQMYRQHLQDQGYPIDGMKQPVLVRINRGDMDMPQRAAFAMDANRQAQLAMSSTEKAIADAKNISDDLMTLAKPGDLLQAQNRGFVRNVLAAIASTNEQGALVNPEGGLSQEGLRRVQGAVLAKAYGDPSVIQTLMESTDNNYRAIGNALIESAPMWAKMRSSIASGNTPHEVDITPYMMDAIRVIARARAEGRNVVEYVKQEDMFSGQAVDSDTQDILRWFLGGNDFTKRIGQAKIANTMQFYAQEALKIEPGPGLFGEEPVPVKALMENARVKGQQPEPGDEQPDLLRPQVAQPAGAETAGNGNGAGRAEGRGLRPGEAGESASNDGQDQVAFQRETTSTPQFKRWFGKSKVIDEKGKPQVVYHGSGTAIEKFDYRFTGQGNDQLGSGFYFTTDPEEASQYTTRTLPGGKEKLGGTDNPSITKAYLSIKNPLDAEKTGTITQSQVRKFIDRAPEKEMGLSNWGENLNEAMREAVHAYALRGDNILKGLHKIANDFYGDKTEDFNRAVHDILGYDGVRSDYEGKQHYVAFFPEQIKSTDNSGTFDLNDPRIKFERSADAGKPITDSSGKPLAPGLSGIGKTEYTAREKELMDAVNKEAARLFPQAKPEAFSKLIDTENKESVSGAAYRDGERRILAYSLEPYGAAREVSDVTHTIRHEGIHHLRRDGIIAPHEWNVLAAAAKNDGWLDQYKIADRYGKLGKDQQIEEAVAEKFADYRNGLAKGLPESIRPLFAKLHLFFKRIGAAAREVMGKDVTADDILARIESGQVGRRDVRGAPPEIDTSFQRGAGGDKYAARRINTPYEFVQAVGRGVGQYLPDVAKSTMTEIMDSIRMAATPMALGTDRARAAAKRFSNLTRLASLQRTMMDNYLLKNFSKEQRVGMWNAMDETSVHVQKAIAAGMDKDAAIADAEKNNIGIFKLPAGQREILRALSDNASKSWERARAAGMVTGEGLPFWTPRMAAVIGADGTWETPQQESGSAPSLDSMAPSGSISTTTGSLKQRKYLTAADTEAAMKARFGDNAAIVRDIRAMALATSRLDRAVAGRELINQIKEIGKMAGAKTVSDGADKGYFTIDHPAFKTFRPQLEKDAETGKWSAKKDENGDPLFEKVPIYVSKEFEGPLRAVLRPNSGPVYNAMMQMKGKATGLIMYSPLIHNLVEFGRALPVMPGKVATFRVYFDGNKAKNDPAQMREAVEAGMVPIGHRFFNQDISSLMEEPNLAPGRSWTAKLLGGAIGKVNKESGEQFKQAVDSFGNLWHNTLLWDRVADLQMGLYTNVRDDLLKKGLDQNAATKIAAHFANRYAGALPIESMGVTAQRLANVSMFSRSFTLGNFGVMKDVMTGLPADVRSQLIEESGKGAADYATRYARRKATATFALDIAFMYAGNAIAQNVFDNLKRDKSLSDIEKGYADRFDRMLSHYKDTPSDLLSPTLPFDLMEKMSPLSENEPGKEDRIYYSRDPQTNTAYYLRLPTGKVGEEFKNWLTSPLDMMRKKLSTIIKPALEIFNNSDYFGNPIYDKNAKGFSGALGNVGKVVAHIMEGQVPTDSIKSAYNALTGIASGKGVQAIDAMKTLGPLTGVTFSKGYPGGPEAGILADTRRNHSADISAAIPDIKDKVQAGDITGAHAIMEGVGMSRGEQNSMIKRFQTPQSRVNPTSLKAFYRTATPEARARMDRQMQQDSAP